MDTFKITLFLTLALLSACQNFQRVPTVNIAQHTKGSFTLKTLDNEPYQLKDTIQQHQATVLIWWATQCPCVERFKERIHALRERYPKDQVAIIAISSNADDDADSIKEAAQKRHFQIPILIDTHSRLANLLDVQTTPTAILIDKNGNLIFKGWIDNERTPEQAGRIAYLQNAIDELLAKRIVTVKESPTYGCMITKSLRQ